MGEPNWGYRRFVIGAVAVAILIAVGMAVSNRIKRNAAMTGPASLQSAWPVELPDGRRGAAVLGWVGIHDSGTRFTGPYDKYRIDIVDLTDGSRIAQRWWPDRDRPQCVAGGPGWMWCKSDEEDVHRRSTDTLEVIDGSFETPPNRVFLSPSGSCRVQYRFVSAPTSARHQLQILGAHQVPARTCKDEYIEPKVVCDEHDDVLHSGAAVVVQHTDTLLSDRPAALELSAVDDDCATHWHLVLDGGGVGPSFGGEDFVVIGVRRGTDGSRLMAVDPQGAIVWQYSL